MLKSNYLTIKYRFPEDLDETIKLRLEAILMEYKIIVNSGKLTKHALDTVSNDALTTFRKSLEKYDDSKEYKKIVDIFIVEPEGIYTRATVDDVNHTIHKLELVKNFLYEAYIFENYH